MPLASSQLNLYDIYLLLCVQCQTPDDGRKTRPKHVVLYSKNKFEKLVHLFGFIIRIYHDARSSECVMKVAQNNQRRIRGKLNKHLGISGSYFPLYFVVKDVLERCNERTTQCSLNNVHIIITTYTRHVVTVMYIVQHQTLTPFYYYYQ